MTFEGEHQVEHFPRSCEGFPAHLTKLSQSRTQEVDQLDEQFATFVGILDLYLRTTSPQEINISSKMAATMTTFQTL